ncbi:hypothetical protein CUJ91_12835 [Paraburkholderia graminis]|jgi:hypothetical protein|nr:hypothetical protein CUJ91_12835 [Paraburkholderia graminis]
MTEGVARSPRAHGLRGNLTHMAESALKPDRFRFECNSTGRGMIAPPHLAFALAARPGFSKN